jgi:hypothetical protein
MKVVSDWNKKTFKIVAIFFFKISSNSLAWQTPQDVIKTISFNAHGTTIAFNFLLTLSVDGERNISSKKKD